MSDLNQNLPHPSRSLSDKSQLKPIHALRAMIVAAALSVAVAMLPTHSEAVRSFAEGLALGLLVGLTVLSFSIKSVDATQSNQPSDVQTLRIT